MIRLTSHQEIITHLHTLADEQNRTGMARFGIETSRAFGISVTTLRSLAKSIKADCKADTISLHNLVLELWETGFHEARLLAILLDNPKEMTTEQIESWVRDLDSWDTCDQLCSNLLWKLPNADALIQAWCAEEAVFVRRAGFALIAVSAVHDKKAPDARFHTFFPLLEQYAYDDRNFVKKAINWAVRQIGKRNPRLQAEAIELAKRIKSQDTKSARWIASDALRELENYIFRTKPKRSSS